MRRSLNIYALLFLALFALAGCAKEEPKQAIVRPEQPQQSPVTDERDAPTQEATEEIIREFHRISPVDVRIDDLRECKGTYPPKLFERDDFRELGAKVFGDDYVLFMKNLQVSGSKIVQNGSSDCIIFYGNAPHEGTSENCMLSIDLYNGSVTGAILSDMKLKIYSTESDIESIPQAAKDEIGDMTKWTLKYRDRW